MRLLFFLTSGLALYLNKYSICSKKTNRHTKLYSTSLEHNFVEYNI